MPTLHATMWERAAAAAVCLAMDGYRSELLRASMKRALRAPRVLRRTGCRIHGAFAASLHQDEGEPN